MPGCETANEYHQRTCRGVPATCSSTNPNSATKDKSRLCVRQQFLPSRRPKNPGASSPAAKPQPNHRRQIPTLPRRRIPALPRQQIPALPRRRIPAPPQRTIASPPTADDWQLYDHQRFPAPRPQMNPTYALANDFQIRHRQRFPPPYQPTNTRSTSDNEGDWTSLQHPKSLRNAAQSSILSVSSPPRPSVAHRPSLARRFPR